MTWTLWRGAWPPSPFTLRLVIKTKQLKCHLPPLSFGQVLLRRSWKQKLLQGNRYLLPGDALSYKLVFRSHTNKFLSPVFFIAFCHLSDSCEFLMPHRKIWNRGSMSPKSRGWPNKRFATSGLKIITRTSGDVDCGYALSCEHSCNERDFCQHMFLDALASLIILESPSEEKVGLQNPSRLLLFQIGRCGQSLPIGKRL